MLHRLVRDLVEEEGRAAEAAAETRLREEGSKRDEAKALREQKKQQALERSRCRRIRTTVLPCYLFLKNDTTNKSINQSINQPTNQLTD